MRLGAGVLIALGGLGLAAQTPRVLPWEKLPRAPWESRFDAAPDAPLPPSMPPDQTAFRVRIDGDGALTVLDGRGVIRLKGGLPGRPRAVWRDGGQPLLAPWTAIPFGPGTLGPAFRGEFWNTVDPRTAMTGLLWILDDGERTLSLVHPATGRVAFVPLPEAEGVDLRFLPTGLEALERLPPAVGSPRRGRRWVLPWMALLPSLLQLEPSAETQNRGTALHPFPKDGGF